MKLHLLSPSSCGVLAILSLMIKESSAELQWNVKGSPTMLSDTTDVCSSNQGRTSNCEVELDIPASCVDEDDTSNCPIVFFLHGAGGSNNAFKQNSDVHDNGVIGVYPQGEDGWNTGPKNSNECPWDDFDCSYDPDEGALMASIISTLRDMGANGNIYAIGSSNGGALANRLGSNAGNSIPIKGFVALVTQLLSSPERNGPGVLNYNQPQGSTPVSVLNVMGTGDGLIPYGGGSSGVFGGDTSFQLYPAIQSMEVWSDYNGCDTGNPIIEAVTTGTETGGDGTGTFYRYPNCSNGAIVEHYAVNNAGHNAGATSISGNSDRDIQYDFIRRCEESDPTDPGPPPAPTPPLNPSPTAAPVYVDDDTLPGDCVDDPNWHGKANTDHNCEFVAARSQRCAWESTDGVLASTACKVACNTCEDVDDDNESLDDESPDDADDDDADEDDTEDDVDDDDTEDNVDEDDEVDDECVDDPTWEGKYSAAHNCEYAAEMPNIRCNFVNSEGTPASEACKLSCGTC